MNPMMGQAEGVNIAAVCDDRAKLKQWYQEQFAEEMYKDGRYNKRFKKDSPLEWFNALHDIDSVEPETWGCGVKEEWVIEADINPKYYRV